MSWVTFDDCYVLVSLSLSLVVVFEWSQSLSRLSFPLSLFPLNNGKMVMFMATWVELLNERLEAVSSNGAFCTSSFSPLLARILHTTISPLLKSSLSYRQLPVYDSYYCPHNHTTWCLCVSSSYQFLTVCVSSHDLIFFIPSFHILSLPWFTVTVTSMCPIECNPLEGKSRNGTVYRHQNRHFSEEKVDGLWEKRRRKEGP